MGRVLDLFGIDTGCQRWGEQSNGDRSPDVEAAYRGSHEAGSDRAVATVLFINVAGQPSGRPTWVIRAGVILTRYPAVIRPDAIE